MNIDEWEKEIELAIQLCDLQYRPTYSEIIMKSYKSVDKEKEKPLVVDVRIAMERYFWNKVCKGETFGEIGRIEKQFCKSVEQNYGLSTGPFIDLARTYWTFKVETDDLSLEYSHLCLFQALLAVDINVRQLFFPTSGPVSVPRILRRSEQKQYLKQFAPSLDIKRFLKENPML